MKKFLYMFLCLFIMIISCKQEQVEAFGDQNSIEIDGHANDWLEQPSYFFQDYNMIVSVANNDSVAKVLVKFNNQSLERQMLMGGVSFGWNSNGSKKAEYFIKFAGQPGMAPRPNRSDKPEEHQNHTKAMWQEFFAHPIFVDGTDESALDNVNGIEVGANKEGDAIVLEFQIPMNNVNLKYSLINQEDTWFCFEIQGMKQGPMGKHPEYAMSGNMGSGGRPPQGIGMGGRGGGMRNPGAWPLGGPSENMSKSFNECLKVKWAHNE